MNEIKIVVVGAGAMGSLFGGLLAEKGLHVILLDPWKEHVEQIKQNGLRIVGYGGDRSIAIKAVCSGTQISAADIVFFQCKAVCNDSAAASVQHLFTPETKTIAISFQNGLGNEEKIAKYLGSDRILGGLTAQGANIESAGVVRNHAELPSYIGEMKGGISSRAQNAAQLFTQYGLPVEAVDNIRSCIWEKLFANVGISSVSGILDMNIGQIAVQEDVLAVSYAAIDEALLVAKAENIFFTQEQARKMFNSILDPNKGTPSNKSSLCMDILSKRPSEIDYINGAVSYLGKKHNIPTPINNILTRLVKGKESFYIKK